MALWFCNRLATEAQQPVRLMLIAKGSLEIAAWHPTTGAQYQEIVDVWAAAAPSPADIVLWHQGESDQDAGTSEVTYKAAFLEMLAALRGASIVKASAPVIVGGLLGTYAPYNSVLENLVSEHGEAAHLLYASANGFSTYDNVHFTGPEMHRFGSQRMWNAYATSVGPRVVSGRVSVPMFGYSG